jgi:hypothetical protein
VGTGGALKPTTSAPGPWMYEGVARIGQSGCGNVELHSPELIAETLYLRIEEVMNIVH